MEEKLKRKGNKMKQFRYVILALLFLLPISSVPAHTQIRLFSHRCLGTPFPENSVAAVHVLAKAGIHGAEVDLRTTKDGHIVILHDEHLDRTTTGTGPVVEKNWKEIQILKLKDRTGNPTLVPVPDFTAVLKAVKQHPKFELALDLKAVDAVKAAKTVLEHAMAKQVTFFVADPLDTTLAKSLTRLHPDIRIVVDMLTWWKIEDVPLFAAKALDAHGLFAREWFFPKRGFKHLGDQNIPVLVYLWGTHDLETRFTRAAQLGACCVSTDDPIRLIPLAR